MNSKIFKPGKHEMVICPFCYGCGYTYNPHHQICTSCEGFGLIKWETERDTDISPNNDQLAGVTQG